MNKFVFNPSASLVKSILNYQKFASGKSNFGFIIKILASFNYRSEISKFMALSPDLNLPHPNGIVVHQNVVIGHRCMIMQQVTIGQLADGRVPVIGNGVYIGAGAKILGGIVINDNAVIGANAVVLIDVPAGKTAVGVPAKILAK